MYLEVVLPQTTIFTKETNVFGSGFTTKNHIYKRNQCIWKWVYHKESYLQKKPMYLEVGFFSLWNTTSRGLTEKLSQNHGKF